MMKLKTRLFIFALGVFSNFANAQIYKCSQNGQAAKYQNMPCEQSQTIQTTVNLPKVERKQITLEQTQGHFFLIGELNKVKTTFLIDTGASMVALPQSLAKQAKILCSHEMVEVSTANGKVKACLASVEKLTLAPFQFENVQVLIHPNLDMPLLGMSVLQKFNIEQRGGKMRLFER